MKRIALAGGGLSSWYVIGRLFEQGAQVAVWYADAGQLDEQLRHPFLHFLEAKGIPTTVEDLRPSLASLGLEIARAQARHRNGYWNTTGLLRVALSAGCAAHMANGAAAEDFSLAHGCVGLGNDQRRFDRLFASLLPDSHVETLLPDWSRQTGSLTRAKMVEQISGWLGGRLDALDAKAQWSTDGSVLGVSYEGMSIEDHGSDWTEAPFVMTEDPLRDTDIEHISLTMKCGRLVRVDGCDGSALDLLTAANERAGRHGIGRIGVMEDRLKGTKCRGVYEAPGLTLIGHAWAALQELCLAGETLTRLGQLSRAMASDVYAGRWHHDEAAARRAEIDDICSTITGTVSVAMRGGHLQANRVETDAVAAVIERRFAGGGVVWSEASEPVLTA